MRPIIIIFSHLVCNCLYSQDNKMYPCKTVSNIGVQIADYKSEDSITIDALLKAGRVKAETGKLTILSYKVILDGSGFCDLYEIDNPGDKFTENTLLVFRKLRRGIFMSIDCISAKDSDGHITSLKPAVYIIR